MKELHIPQNSLRSSITLILKSLNTLEHLEVLDIDDNHVSKEAAEQVAQLIRGQKSLKALNLNDCNINEKMNNLILEAMESLKGGMTLEKIGYKYNELYEEEYSQQSRFIDVLMSNKANLKKIEISGNDIEDEMREYYLATLKKHGLPREVMSKFESDDDEEGYEPIAKEIKFEELTF